MDWQVCATAGRNVLKAISKVLQATMKLAGMLILNFSIVNVSCTPAWAYFTSEGSKQIWHGFLPHFWGWWAQSSLFPFIYAPQIQPLSVAVISAVTKVWSLTGFPPVNTASLQLDWSQGSSPFLSLSLQITSAATRKLFDRFPPFTNAASCVDMAGDPHFNHGPCCAWWVLCRLLMLYNWMSRQYPVPLFIQFAAVQYIATFQSNNYS